MHLGVWSSVSAGELLVKRFRRFSLFLNGLFRSKGGRGRREDPGRKRETAGTPPSGLLATFLGRENTGFILNINMLEFLILEGPPEASLRSRLPGLMTP